MLVPQYLYQFSSVIQLCVTLCNPMDCSTLGFPVLYYVPEFAQILSTKSVMPSNHLILCQPLLLLLSIFPSIRIFSKVSSSHQVAKVLELQHQSFQIQCLFPLGLIGLLFLQSKGHSRVFSSTTVWKHQFFSVQSSLWSNSHIRTDYWENCGFDYMNFGWQSDVFAF